MRPGLPSGPVRLTTGPVAVIELHGPGMNRFDDLMQDALVAAVRAVGDDPGVRCCVIHGGPDHFAAGADIRALAAMDYEAVSSWNARLQGVFSAVAALPVPVVAAVNGFALGGGLELALAADIRIGSTECLLGLPELTLGILPGAGGTQRLTRIVGRSAAMLLMLSGRRIPAEEALRLGLLDELVPAPSTISRALELAAAVAQASPYAVRAIKSCVGAADPVDPTALALERSLLAGMFATSKRAEAMTRFLQQRERPRPANPSDPPMEEER